MVLLHPLDVARHLTVLGFSVIPFPPPLVGLKKGHPGDGKTPAMPWTTYQTRQATDEEVIRWFGGAPMNLAIVTGVASGCVVVDADGDHAREWCAKHLPHTCWQVRTGRGHHLYYLHPGGRVHNKVGLRTRAGQVTLDVRGDGGYVIAPPSVHHGGAVYRFVSDWTISRGEIPVFDPLWFTARQPPQVLPIPRRSNSRSEPNAAICRRAERYLSQIPLPVIGAGSDVATLKAACRLVRGFALPADEAVRLLWRWAGGREGWTHEYITSKVASAIRYGSEPVGGLR